MRDHVYPQFPEEKRSSRPPINLFDLTPTQSYGLSHFQLIILQFFFHPVTQLGCRILAIFVVFSPYFPHYNTSELRESAPLDM